MIFQPARKEDDGLVDLHGITFDRAFPPFNADHSIPMHCSIHGRSSYLRSLEISARKLYDAMADDYHIRSSQGANVELPGGTKGRMPIFPRKPRKTVLRAIKHMLHSLANIASNPLTVINERISRRECISLPMSPSAYGRRGEYDLDFRSIQGMVIALGSYQPDASIVPWLQVARGYDYGEGRRTRIAPSEDFKTWMLQHDLIFPMHPAGRTIRHSKANKSVIWRSEKTDIFKFGEDKAKFPIDRPLEGDEFILPLVNKRLGKAKIEYRLLDYAAYTASWDYARGHSKLPYGPGKLYRLFAEEDGRGGRLFGHWAQSMSGAMRRGYLTINGKPVVELDYGSMQLTLLYAMARIPVPENDLYDPEGKGQHHREDMKMVLTVSVGCSTRQEAMQAIRKKLRDERRYRAGKAESLYDALWGLYEAVCPHGKATEAVWPILQRSESDIALRVLRYLEEDGIVVIPIHDSFIVQSRHKDRLRSVMHAAFADYFPKTRVTIK